MLQLTHYQKGSFSFVKNDGGQIVSAVYSGREIKLGQKVYSNGRIFVPAGTIGIVVRIHEPGDGLTSNIFEVWFEGEPSATLMKTKDLDFTNETPLTPGVCQDSGCGCGPAIT